jgi:hypothetical protein
MTPGARVKLSSPYGGLCIDTGYVQIRVTNGAEGVIDNMWTERDAPKVKFDSTHQWVQVPLHWLEPCETGPMAAARNWESNHPHREA